jgi:phage antirepressor YoqD-like protein
MAQLNQRVNNEIYIPISRIARDLGMPEPDLEQWLREQESVTLRKVGEDQIGVDPLELRRCLDAADN